MSSDKGITLGELAKKINAKLVGDPNKLITGINTLLRANEDEVSFLSRDRFIKDLKTVSNTHLTLPTICSV